MRRKALLTAAVVICAAPTVWARAAGDKISFVYYPELPRPHVTVTNNYSSPATAVMLVTPRIAPKGKPDFETNMLDTGVYWRRDRPIAPGTSARIGMPYEDGQDPSVLRPEVVAAVFEDGFWFGDPVWVAMIRNRWQAAYDEIGKVEALLRKAQSDRLPTDVVASSIYDGRVGPDTALTPDMTSMQVAQWLEPHHVAAAVADRAYGRLRRAAVDGVAGEPQQTISALLTEFGQWRCVLKPLLAEAARFGR